MEFIQWIEVLDYIDHQGIQTRVICICGNGNCGTKWLTPLKDSLKTYEYYIETIDYTA